MKISSVRWQTPVATLASLARVAVVLTMVVLTMVVLTMVVLTSGVTVANAQQPPARSDAHAAKSSSDANSTLPFETSFVPAGSSHTVELSIEPSVAADQLNLRIVERTGGAQSPAERVNATVPAWIGRSHYGYDITSRALSDAKSAVILTVKPGVNGKAPPGATQFQVVWIISDPRSNPAWTRLAAAHYSTLDGGQQFRFADAGRFDQLIRQRGGRDSIFCGSSDQQPVLVEHFDPAAKSFVQDIDVGRVVAGAETIDADPAAPEFNPPALHTWYQWFAASSDQRSPRDHGAIIRPLELGDGQPETAWLEGGDGLGRGEFVSAQISEAAPLASIRLVPGLGGSKEQFEAFAQPSRIVVSLSNGKRYLVDIAALDYDQVRGGRGVIIELPTPQTTSCMSVMLVESRPGTEVDGQPDTAAETVAVSELTPYSTLHGSDTRATAERIVERIGAESDRQTRQRIAEMAKSLDATFSAVILDGLDDATGAQRVHLIPLLRALPADTAVPLLIDMLRQTTPAAPEYRTIRRSLATFYAAAADDLVTYLEDPALDTPGKRVDLLRLLGRVGRAEHLLRLVNELGKGPPVVRNERIRAIASGGQPMVGALLNHARSSVDTNAGIDALRALNALGKRLYYQGQGQLKDPEKLLEVIDRGQQPRTRILAAGVARYFNADGFVEPAARMSAADQPTMVRKAAVGALGHYDGRRARKLIVGRLADASPDVRIAAIGALHDRQDADQAAAAVIDYTRTETWQAGLREAFRTLADIDTPAATAAFRQLFDDHPNSDAALLAAQALNRAQRAVGADLARAIISDPKIVLDLRLEMIDALGIDDSEAGQQFLLDLMATDGWQRLADSQRARDQVHEHVILSLGRRRSAQSVGPLLELVRHGQRLDVRKIGLRALAFYADAELSAQLKAWRDAAPADLRATVDETIAMIERRQALISVRHNIDDVIDAADASETNHDSDASEQTDDGER